MLVLLFSYLLTGLLFMALSIPLIQRRVKPNPWYGFRVPKTLRDERIWYKANAYSGVLMFLSGAVTALAALALVPLAWLLRLNPESYGLACMLVMLGSLVWALVLSFRYLRKL
jgi:uncharacterized membrane protein